MLATASHKVATNWSRARFPVRVLARCIGSTPPRPATHADEVLQWPPVVLTDAQRRQYFQRGCLCLPGFISSSWVQRLRALADEYVEMSRSASKIEGNSFHNCGDGLSRHFVLAPDHTAKNPKIIRLISPPQLHSTFWEFATGPVADVAQDLLGPDVRLHHSKLNFKMANSESTKVQWHQDIQFWPHTNYTPLTIGVYLQDVDDEMGPMDVIPLNAYDRLHPLEDESGNWTGVLRDEVLRSVPWEQAERMKGPAGTVTVHNARCVHGGSANTTSRDRLLLLHTFAAATAHPLDAGTNPLHKKSKYGMPMVRGKPTNLAVFDPRPCPMAPSFEHGYKVPFFDKNPQASALEEKPLMDG